MYDCERWQELMSQMLDDEISQEDAAALRGHMRTCQSCQAMWNLLFTVSRTIQQDVEQPPAGLSQGVMARIQEDRARDGGRPAGNSRKKRTRPLPRWTRAAAAACLALVIGAVAYASLDGRGQSAGGSSLSIRAASSAAMDTTADTAESAGVYEEAAQEAYGEAAAEDADGIGAAADTAAAQAGTEDSGAGLAVYDMDGNLLGSISPKDEDAFAALLDYTAYSEAEIVLKDICSVEYQGVIYVFSTDESGQLLLWRDAAEGYPFCSTSNADALWALIS